MGSGATQEQKRWGWETFVRTEKILVKVLHAALNQQAEETIDADSDRLEGLYGWPALGNHSLLLSSTT